MHSVKDNNEKVFFFGLNELRSLAAFVVVLHHLEIYKNVEGMASLKDYSFFKSFISYLGHNGVMCFFVLSGFLITYLLIIEKEKTNTIQIKNFYIRRILRIWPLYFLILFFGYVIFPLVVNFPLFANQTYYPNLVRSLDYKSIILFVLFLSNMALVFFKPVMGASQSWSVSVEEQFYLLWPLLVKKTKSIKTLVFVIACAFFVKIGFNEYLLIFYGKTFWLTKVMSLFQIEYMCIGAIGAICIYSGWQKRFDYILKNKLMILAMYLVLLCGLFCSKHYPIVLALLFLYIIYILISSNFSNKFLNYFGKISFGIYMFHPVIMFFTFSFSRYVFSSSTILFNICYYTLTIGITLLVSHLSYHYFESYFLKFKTKFSVIKSGE